MRVEGPGGVGGGVERGRYWPRVGVKKTTATTIDGAILTAEYSPRPPERATASAEYRKPLAIAVSTVVSGSEMPTR